MKKSVFGISLFLCTVMLFSSCVLAADKKPVKEKDWDTLTYALSAEPDKLDPHNSGVISTSFIGKQIYSTLVVRNDVTGKIEPGLATTWKWQDDKTLVMNLRNDVFFHNGDKFTAKDVIFSLEHALTGSFTSTLFKAFDVKNSKAIDDYTVEIKLKEVYAPTLSLLAGFGGTIFSKNYAESVDEVTFGREPVGTGPFKFVSWTTGDNLTFVRNDQYWGKKPSFSKLVMPIINQISARAIEIETGGVDIVVDMFGDDIARYKNNEAPGVVAYTVPGVRVFWLAFNEDDPIMANEKVRQAFACAIDPTVLTDVGFVLGVGAEVAASSIPASVTGYQPQPKRTVDIEKGKQLLAEAGYPDGFTCTLVINESAHNVRMGEAMQAQLREIGVNLELDIVISGMWVQMAMDGTSKLSIQTASVDTFDPDHALAKHYADSAIKVARTYDKTVNRLLNQGRSELDNAKRMAIYAELQKYIHDHAIQINIAEPIVAYAARDYIEGLVPHPAAQVDLTKIVINH